uniref:BAT2 N-terminal domain-containing protein n=1 Tax=Kalanchoe fedtschenkoi TaxID=63787 RepID=A0A7N0TJK6_KALFE
MTSSMGTGERKWASSTRRGGMTVLGKVAVPKPINLPSQKLENHGMDPNVEIVPKGTLSWGSRSSSPASNAWGSSSLSLNTDNGRPSSGGSGTRPSTGGSDKAYESSTNAWGSNSRPSSASGALTSSQASGASLRPRSADTRPGSSQLSRFAEPSNENSVAWAAAGSGDNMAHSKNGNFSLSSGDFPTLGSEKEDPPKIAHTSPEGDDTVPNARINRDNVDHGRRDSPPYEEGRRPNIEKWQGDPLQRNPNMSMPPQHFPPWHGAPVGSPPVGVWYRGPPGAPSYVPPGGPRYGPPGAPPYGQSGPPYGPSGVPPYGPLIGPGGFPVEHPYYRPPMPAPVIGNSHPVPHHGSGPRGLHQNNGEMYRPHIPDGHFRPGMPMRPGFFPGPVPYEGYYPPPIGYCGPNDRDHPFMGPAGGPAVYDRHLNPNDPDTCNSQSATVVHVSNEKPSGPDQVSSGQRHEPHEQYKVLLKQQGVEHEWGGNTTATDSQFEKGYRRRPSSYEKDQGAGSFNGEKTDSRRVPSREGGPTRGSFTHGGSQFHGRERLSDGAKSMKGGNNVEKNLVDELSTSEAVGAPKDSSLIKKIEGLNAKARGTDVKQDAALNSSWDEGKSRSHIISKAPHLTNAKSHGGGSVNPPTSHGIEVAFGNKNYELTADGGPNSSLKLPNSGPQIRTDYRGKGKPDILETEGRRSKAHSGHISTTVSSSKLETVNLELQDHRLNMSAGKPESSLEGKDIVPDSASLSIPIDIQEQRAKKREIAKQRAMQLQREEEERIKEQKAKAQAKLEELDRRTKLMESSTVKVEMVSSGGLTNCKEEDSQPELPVSIGIAPESRPSLEISPLVPNNISPGTQTLEPQRQISKRDHHGDVMSHQQSYAEPEGGHHETDAKVEPQHYGGNNANKHKRKGLKEKQKLQPEKIVKDSVDSLKYGNDATEEVTKNVSVLAEPVGPQRTKNNMTGKNKHKMEEASSSSAIMQTVAPKNADVVKASVDSGVAQSPNVDELSQLLPPVSSIDWSQSTGPQAPQLKEETLIRVNNYSRYQNSRKQPRNQQGNRTVDKSHGSDTVIWAPVRQQNKVVIEDSSLKVVTEEAGDKSKKSDHVQNSIKNKRAEIERYVPKPVAKELAQQVGVQQPTSPTTKSTDSSATKVETAFDSRVGDNNYNRHARAPGAWRQRFSAESSHGHGLEDGSLGSAVVSKVIYIPTDKNKVVHLDDIHIPTEKNKVIHLDSSDSQENKKLSDGWNSPDEWNNNAGKVSDASVPSLRDQGSFNRGKRHYNKGNRNTGTYTQDGLHVKGQTQADIDVVHSHSTVSNSAEQDRIALCTEPHLEGGHPSSYWNSKSQNLSAHNHRATKPGGAGQNFSGEISRFVKKERNLHVDHFQPEDLKLDDGVSNRPFASAKPNTGSFSNTGPQDGKKERKMVMPRVGSHALNPNSRVPVEQAPPVENLYDRPHSSSGMRKNANQSNRNVRGHESQGEWNMLDQDRRYQNQPSGRSRPRHNNNAHYEYKPKGQGHLSGADGGNLQQERQAIPIQVEAGGTD